MADNYSHFTVEPDLPAEFFTELELQILSVFGLSFEGSTTLYFFSDESRYADEEIEISKVALSDESNFVVRQLLDYIQANDLKDEDGIYYISMENINDDTDVEHEITPETIFHSIIEKAMSHNSPIDEIVIEGTFSCSKMRPGEFGGFVTLITAEKIQSESTKTMLHKMQLALKEPGESIHG